VISVPLEFIPSRLLACEIVSSQLLTREIVSSRAQKLLEQSRQALVEQCWADAERYAFNARDASQRLPGKMVDYAIALIHLADVYRAVGRLGPALDSSEEAQQLLKNQPGSAHYHNRAVADYALGLTHHMLGNDSKAQYWYEHAQDLFERAIPYWGRRGNRKRQEQRARVVQWITTLSEIISRQAGALPDEPFFNLAWFPVFHTETSDQKDKYGLACFLITGRAVKSSQIHVGDQLYTLLRPDGKHFGSKKLDFRAPHFAVEIKKDGQLGKETLQGDLALIRETGLTEPHPVGGTDQTGQDEWGDFVRDDRGRVTFVGKKEPIIIGGDVIALLRPEP
jgi:tetratricopeptide (TPR) repeat protein